MKKEKKIDSKTVIIIAVVLVFIVIIGIAGFTIKGKNSEKSIFGSSIDNLFNKNNPASDKDLEAKDLEPQAIAIIEDLDLYLFTTTNEGAFNNLDNKSKLIFMLQNVKKLTGESDITKLTSSDLLNSMKKLFGNNFTISFEDIYLNNSTEPTFKYNKNTKKYEGNLGIGSASYKAILNGNRSFINIEDDYYDLTVSPLIYIKSEGCELEAPLLNLDRKVMFNYTNTDNSPICSSDEIKSSMVLNSYGDVIEKLKSITYTFKEENGKLYLVKYKEFYEFPPKEPSESNNDNNTETGLKKEEILNKAYALINNLDILELDLYEKDASKLSDFNTISNDAKLWFINKNVSKISSSSQITNVTSDELLNGMKKLFGPSFNVNFENIYLANDRKEPLYKYNNTSKKYESNLGVGRTEYTYLKTENTNYEKNGDYYIITYKPLIYRKSEGCDYGNIKLLDIKNEEVYTYISKN